MPYRFEVALKATETSAVKGIGILVALKATVTEERRWRTHWNPKCGEKLEME